MERLAFALNTLWILVQILHARRATMLANIAPALQATNVLHVFHQA